MKVTDRAQAPPQPVKHQTAQKAPERPQIEQAQPKPQPAKNPSHVGKNVDIKA